MGFQLLGGAALQRFLHIPLGVFLLDLVQHRKIKPEGMEQRFINRLVFLGDGAGFLQHRLANLLAQGFHMGKTFHRLRGDLILIQIFSRHIGNVGGKGVHRHIQAGGQGTDLGV